MMERQCSKFSDTDRHYNIYANRVIEFRTFIKYFIKIQSYSWQVTVESVRFYTISGSVLYIFISEWDGMYKTYLLTIGFAALGCYYE